MHLRWYLTDKKEERMKNQNLPQELNQEQIYEKYALPDIQSSYRNRMNYLSNHFFNAIGKRRVMNGIIMFLV